MKKSKPYKSAFDFWRDLRIQFGERAKAVALGYLDTITAQERRTGHDDPEELIFCCELFSIISEEV